MNPPAKPATGSKRRYLIIGSLVLLNLIAYNLFVKTGGSDLSGHYVGWDRTTALKNSLIAFLLGIPLISFTLGLLFALWPFKNTPYAKRYLRASLSTWLVINALFSIGMLIIAALTLTGRYPQDARNRETHVLARQALLDECNAQADSASFYLDWGLSELENGKDAHEVVRFVKPALDRFADNINKVLQELVDEASKESMSPSEYDRTVSTLEGILNPVKDKIIMLKERGVELH